MLKLRNQKIVLIIFILLFISFSNADYSDNIAPANLSQEDLSFYEINPCKISLLEFVIKENKSIFQDHYRFRANNYSPIYCFGRVAGVTMINGEFSISVGTNTFINLIFQGSLWALFFSLIRKDKNPLIIDKFKLIIAKSFSSIFFTFSIYSEQRFYEKSLYYFDWNDKYLFYYFLIIFYFLISNTLDVLLTRLNNSIKVLPYVIVLPAVFSGANLNIYLILFSTIGFYAFISSQHNKIFMRFAIPFSFFWIFNSSREYLFKVDKLKGFTSSVYEFNGVFFWSIVAVFFVLGILFFLKSKVVEFKLINFSKQISNAVSLILIIGLACAHFPLLNFLSYFILGQHKPTTTQLNPFLFNEFNEKVAWRGFSPSAESIGEISGLALIFFIYLIFTKKIQKQFSSIFLLVLLILSLYFSNNRAVFVMFFLFIFYLLLEKFKVNKLYKLLLVIFIFLLLLLIFGSSNVGYSYEYSSSVMVEIANRYAISDNISSSLYFLNSRTDDHIGSNIIIGLFGIISFFLNRSELWGIFFARYNPTYFEFLLGTGPLNFGQLYSEIRVNQTGSLLLPHSSFLSLLVFIGAIGLSIVLIYGLIRFFMNYKKNTFVQNYIFIFILINLFKSDSILYHNVFILYFYLFFELLKKK